MLGKIEGRRRRGVTKNKMVGWHCQLNGHEFEQALAVGDRQGSLACCSAWNHKESDTTQRLNCTELNTVKGFSIVNEAEIDIFWNSLAFTMIQSYLISGSSSFSKSSLYIWKFSVHVLLKPNLKDFEHDLADM